MKRTAIAILIAVLVVVIGAGLLFAGLSAVNFKFEKLDRTEYMTNTYEFADSIRSLDIKGYTVDVELLPAEDGTCRVVSAENDREQYSVTVQDGTLVIRPVADTHTWSLFSFPFKSPKISVYLPAGTYEQLKAQLDTGDITADRTLSFETVDVSSDTGDLTLSGVQAREITAHSDTGTIRVGDMTPESANLSVHTGKLDVYNLVCSGDLRCESSTGDVRLTDVDGANLYLKASTGDILGTIRTEKVFVASSSTGDVSVPTGTTGGRCEASTSTGDIKLAISGH